MGEFTKDDHKNDECWNPRPELIGVDHLVPENSYKQGADGDYNNACPTGNVVIDGVDELRSYN